MTEERVECFKEIACVRRAVELSLHSKILTVFFTVSQIQKLFVQALENTVYYVYIMEICVLYIVYNCLLFIVYCADVYIV